MPVDQNQLETLNAHKRNKVIAKIQYFYTIACKDTITTKQLIIRIEHAATVCNWTNDQKALQRQCSLRGNAPIWLEAQEKSYFLDIKDWTELPKCFLKPYDTVVTSASLSISI